LRACHRVTALALSLKDNAKNGTEMSIPPLVVRSVRQGWQWQWRRLMTGLGPADDKGNYQRPDSTPMQTSVLEAEDLRERDPDRRPRLLIGRSCPWAHRTWLMVKLRGLDNSLDVLTVKADHEEGRWRLDPSWLGCSSLLELYRRCGAEPSLRATVPVLVDPGRTEQDEPRLLGNDSTPLSAALNRWPAAPDAPDLSPPHLEGEIERWQTLLQPAVNDGVYRCGFARNQAAYAQASGAMFAALEQVEQALATERPWLCGSTLTLADVRLFPTLIRLEAVYAPLFRCSAKPLWMFPRLWDWRKRFLALPGVEATCDASTWRTDYFGALFPLNPGGIIPEGPNLSTLVESTFPLP
jgi:putative glutathione S-transferase